MAEQLLLESGEGDLTLDSLALQLDLAKGTLYKHFSSKDELLLRILIDYEQRMFLMNDVGDGAGAGVARIVLQLLNLPHRAVLFNHIEERLSSTTSGLNKMFGELYTVRRERMVRLAMIVETYLQEQNSGMTTRDYLATIYAVGQGGASLLNSTFYQRYLGRRDTLKQALVKQMLDLPKLYPKCESDAEQDLQNAQFSTELSEAVDIEEIADAIGARVEMSI
ncbi:TetR family transcriptional regulator [Moraxella pluranimalium]|uniref:TetR family transcriptional regulator n=2 Tax=Moraxella pluranimalium TaxID=470453 RepID=A0A1T0CM34_9GAMM|nr:TetR family transcriptional regulator [Moraxella pluranimalium]